MPPRCAAAPRLLLTASALTSALFALPSVALAQVGPPMDARKMEVTVSGHVFYDSNILRRRDDAPASSQVHPSDIVAEPSVGFEIVAPFGRQSVFANGMIGYRLHAHNSFLDRERANVTGGVRLRPIRPCTATASATYLRQQSDLANIFDTVDPRNRENIATGAADLACAIPGGLATGLGYRRTSATNSAAIRKENEYESHSYTGSIGLSRPQLGVLAVYGSYGQTRYPNRVPLASDGTPIIGGPEDGMQVYSTGVRYERQLGTRLTGTVSGGYTKVKPRLPGVPGFKGANWAADLTYDSRNRIRASLSASRAVEASNLIGATYGIVTGYRLGIDYALSPRYKLSTGVGYARRRYEQSPYYQLPSFNSRDRTLSVYASLSIGNVGPVEIVVDAAREHRKAAVSLYNYGSTRLGVTATYRFGH